MAIEVYVKMDDSFENVLGYATINANGTYIKVIQDDPVIDISKLYGYSLTQDEESQHHLVFDDEKYEKIEAEKKKEQAMKEAEEKVEQLATKSILDSASDEDAYVMRYLYDPWEPDKKYKTGDRAPYGDDLYRCLSDHTSQADWTPEAAPSLWAKILPGQAGTDIGEWSQPDSTNPYSKGDRVTHNGKTWESLVDGNIWEPGAQGSESLWKEVTE